MRSSTRFRVSLHVSHPKLSADDITASFSLRPKYTKSVGAPRISKLGEDLGGVYLQTDVSFAVSEGVVNNDEVLLTEFVDQSMRDLPLEAIDHMVASGGTCFFFIGVYSAGNFLCDFRVNLLSRLADHGIGLKLDFYGGPEE